MFCAERVCTKVGWVHAHTKSELCDSDQPRSQLMKIRYQTALERSES
jgi:hypothetical protein